VRENTLHSLQPYTSPKDRQGKLTD
jgi:hypothetical protein